jgi:hypothetical protein
MMRTIFRRISILALAAWCAPLAPAQNQNDAEIACRESAAQYARTGRINVGTDIQSSRAGIWVIDWQVRDNRGTYRGYCEVDRNGRVQRIEQTQGANLGGGPGKGKGGSIFDPPGGGNAAGAPPVSVSTAGRGTFSFGGRGAQRLNVDRAWVDTRASRPSVGLNIDGRRVNFYGAITNRRSDVEFDMTIDDSSEGRATGNARFRLNRDRNEVEMVSVDGQLRGSRFDGTFTR